MRIDSLRHDALSYPVPCVESNRYHTTGPRNARAQSKQRELLHHGTTDQLCITQGRLPLLHPVSHHAPPHSTSSRFTLPSACLTILPPHFSNGVLSADREGRKQSYSSNVETRILFIFYRYVECSLFFIDQLGIVMFLAAAGSRCTGR